MRNTGGNDVLRHDIDGIGVCQCNYSSTIGAQGGAMNNIGDKVIISMSGLTVCADIIGLEPLTVRIGKSSRLVIGASERAQIINVNTGRAYGNISNSASGGYSKCPAKEPRQNTDKTSRRTSPKYYRVSP